MTAEPARVEKRAATIEAAAEAEDDREQAVETIGQLLASGRPISEILDAAKRLAVQSKATQPDGDAEPGKLTFHIVGNSCIGASDPRTALTEPIDATVGQQVVGSADVLDRSTNAALAAGPSNGQQSLETTPVRGAWRTTLFGLLRPVIFWLVPALSLILVATIGKISIDAGIAQRAANALTIAMAGTVPSSESAPFSSAAASTLVVQPDHAERRSAEPDRAESPSAEPNGVEQPSAEPNRAEPRLTPEEIKALLNRGDALVGTADIASARLFYERAATAGDAQAAVRLGATYDPAFLAQIKFGGVRGDRAIAQYWYQRARDLGANLSEMPLHSGAPAQPPSKPDNDKRHPDVGLADYPRSSAAEQIQSAVPTTRHKNAKNAMQNDTKPHREAAK